MKTLLALFLAAGENRRTKLIHFEAVLPGELELSSKLPDELFETMLTVEGFSVQKVNGNVPIGLGD